jgi:type I restriction enzyme R subunit
MSRYSYKQSIRDGATNPVKFEPRLAELRVDRDAINEEFEQLATENNLDEEEKAALSRRAGKLAIMLKSPRRMAAVSNDIVEHFTSHVMPKKMKGMVVVYDREACVQMYYLLGEKLGFDAVEVVMNVDQARLKLMRVVKKISSTRTGSNGMTNWSYLLNKDFERWQHIDAEEQVQKDLIECFKDPEHPLQLIIVTAKLLTGFDAPICYCMTSISLYAIILFWAMCRTNRLYETDDVRKDMGLIIDYLGVFENLRTALAYNPEEIEGVVEGIEAFKELLPLQLNKCLSFFLGVDRSIEGFEGIMAAQECLPTNEKRDEFAASFGVLSSYGQLSTQILF